MNGKRIFSAYFIMAIPVAMGLFSGSAEAASFTCSVSRTAWNNDGTVQIDCGGQWHYALPSHATCLTANADARKAWLGLAQTALLSGKRLYIEYTTCSVGRAITYVRVGD